MNCNLSGGSQPAQPFEPPSQRFTIVPLAAEGVMPAKPMMNIGGTALQDRSVGLPIHSQKVLKGNSFDNRVIHARLRPHFERAILQVESLIAGQYEAFSAFWVHCRQLFLYRIREELPVTLGESGQAR